ncbi:MAG TPA: extracellular solute-binding protein [Chloroflexota bacterium]
MMIANRIAGLLSAALLLAACGGSAQPFASSGAAASGGAMTPVQLAAYKGADRQQLLEGGAKKEGTLTWYTSLAGDVLDHLTGAFKQKYGIQVDVFRAAADQLITKATQEAQAGKNVMDVLESPPSTGAIMGEAKLLTPFYSPALANLPQDLQRNPKDGLADGASIRMSLIGFGYNTTLVPDSAVSKTMEDLMNPALTGKLSLTGTETGYRWVGAVLRKMGDDKGKQWLQQLAAQQKPSVQQVSGKAVYDLIAKGEIPASPTIFRDHVMEGASQGAPTKWAPLDPVVANLGQVNMAAKAPHPYSALLFVDFLLTDGEQILAKDHYALPTEKLNFDVWVPEEGRTAAQDEQDLNSWSSLFKSVFR